MASEAQIRANRRNAERSTGPRTEAGKARSRLNARKHGLAAGLSVPEQALVTELAEGLSEVTDPQLAPEHRYPFAEACVRIVQARDERRRLLERFRNDPSDMDVTELARIERYERRAVSARAKWLKAS